MANDSNNPNTTKLKLHEMLGLKPEEAIAYLQAKLPQTTWDKHELSALAHQTTFTVSKLTNAAMLQDVQDALVQALDEGLTMSQFRERLTDKLVAGGWRARKTLSSGQQQITETTSGFMARVNEDGEIGSRFDTPTRLETIFRTNMQSAYMAGRYEQNKSNAEDRPFWRYIAVMDESTRPDHAALDGLVFRHDDPFWQSHTPPNGYNCFLPDTLVKGAVTTGLKAFYAGPAVEVTTAKGNRFALTVNHPILTARGWIGAGLLAQGDELICDQGGVDAQFAVVVDNQQTPVFAKDLFESISLEVFRVSDVSATDFHGDAAGVQGHIDVVTIDSTLTDEAKTSGSHFVKQRDFSGTEVVSGLQTLCTKSSTLRELDLTDVVQPQDAPDVGITGGEHVGDLAARQERILIERADALFEFGVACSRGLPSAAKLTLNQRRVLFDSRPFKRLGLTLITQFDSAQLQRADQRMAAETEVFRQLIDACARTVGSDEVISVRNFDYTGHIYDFQSTTGLLWAGGILSHNCRCRFDALTEDDLIAKGLKATSSAGKMRADEVEYQDGRTMPRKGFDTGNGIVWTDPGFDRRPGATGKEGEADLANLAANSIKKLDPALADETVNLLQESKAKAMGRIVGGIIKKLKG